MTKNITDANQLLLIGENPWAMVFTDPDKPVSTHVSCWTVFSSPAGAGHVTHFRSEDLTGGAPRVYTDNVKLAEWIRDDLLGGGPNAPYKDASVEIVEATFTRNADLPNSLTERIEGGGDVIEATWSDLLDAYAGASVPEEGDAWGHTACYIPAKTFTVTLNGKKADGGPLPRQRDGYETTSCFLALAEAWLKVR